MNNALEPIIRAAYLQHHTLTPENVSPSLRKALHAAIGGLNDGSFRVASKIQHQWQTHEWLKEAILLWFIINSNQVIDLGTIRCYDKLPLKFTDYSATDFAATQVRAVPLTIARYGAYIGPRTVLMPSYINIGAYIDTGTMIDTWATVGSCAQIGKNVHLSGGVGIGGVLEPIHNSPTIIEDDCFIGARSEIVEGVIVEEGAVIAMGVYLSQSTKIYNRATKTITYGVVPAGSVVVPGSIPSADGSYNLSCAIIVKQVDTKTQQKTAINELLRT